MPAPDAIAPDKLVGTHRCAILLDVRVEAAGPFMASLVLTSTRAEPLEAGMRLYDAYHRRAGDATAETHDWPTNRPGGSR